MFRDDDGLGWDVSCRVWTRMSTRMWDSVGPTGKAGGYVYRADSEPCPKATQARGAMPSGTKDHRGENVPDANRRGLFGPGPRFAGRPREELVLRLVRCGDEAQVERHAGAGAAKSRIFVSTSREAHCRPRETGTQTAALVGVYADPHDRLLKIRASRFHPDYSRTASLTRISTAVRIEPGRLQRCPARARGVIGSLRALS